MCEGEAGNKYVGLLTISGKHFKMEPLELKTVRLMHFETIRLSECDEDVSTSKKTQEFVRRQIEDILLKLSLKYSGKFEILISFFIIYLYLIDKYQYCCLCIMNPLPVEV